MQRLIDMKELFPCNDMKHLKVKHLTRGRVALEESKSARIANQDELWRLKMENRGELWIAKWARSINEIRESVRSASLARVTSHYILVEKNKAFLVLFSIWGVKNLLFPSYFPLDPYSDSTIVIKSQDVLRIS